MDLEGLNAIVTGASRGIGRVIARTYARHGAHVTVCARHEDGLKDLCRESTEYPGRIQYITADITNPEDRENLFSKAMSNEIKLDVLVNNAGILGPRATIKNFPDSLWDQVIDVNLNAMFHLTKMALNIMTDQQSDGRIINITSGVGIRGYARWGAYSVSKFGVEGLTQVLAAEMEGTGIEVNAVNPGPISTDMRAEAFPQEDPDSIPSPEDIMDVFLYLASPDGKGNNGQRYEAQDFVMPEQSGG